MTAVRTNAIHTFDQQVSLFRLSTHSLLQCGSVFPPSGRKRMHSGGVFTGFRKSVPSTGTIQSSTVLHKDKTLKLRSAEKPVRHLRRTWLLRVEEKVLDEMELGPKKFNKRQRLCLLTSSNVIKSP